MAKKTLKFEEAMSALEQIVRQLESGNVPLDEALELLHNNGMLIKRPLAFDFENDILLLGFKEESWETALL